MGRWRLSLKEKIIEVTHGLAGTIGITVKHLQTGEEILIEGDTLFPTASVFKLPLLVELYRQVEEGRISLDQRLVMNEKEKVPGSGILRELSPGLEMKVRDYVTLMMVLSDNTATDILLNLVGIENVDKNLRRLGFEKTKVVAGCGDMLFDLAGLGDLKPEERTLKVYAKRRKFNPNSKALGVEDNDVTTPQEMMRLLEDIFRGKVLSRGSCDAILETMKKCQTGPNRIPKYLPREKVEMARKTGSLSGIVNDIGIIYLREKGEQYILCAFTKGLLKSSEGEEAIAKASKIVYDHFTT
jgi:beta-lactamase class A